MAGRDIIKLLSGYGGACVFYRLEIGGRVRVIEHFEMASAYARQHERRSAAMP